MASDRDHVACDVADIIFDGVVMGNNAGLTIGILVQYQERKMRKG